MGLAERYELLEVIARGNMGVVYRARDRRLGRLVALKQILGGESEDDRRRFLREAEVVARLSHPNVVAVHDYGEEGGNPWLVLEYLEGETLAARVRRTGHLSTGLTVEIGASLADALGHAHQAGVLHRDLKPDNVILVEDRPYVVDFGLARLVSRTTRLTATQDMIGTPAYMPPEQAQGEHEHVGPASDLYGLAGTLYFALTGRAPLVGATLLDTLQKIVREIPLPAGSGSPRLDDVLARGLAKDPKQRFASGAEFAEALRASLADTAAAAPHFGQPARRRSLLVATCVLALTFGVGALALFLSRSEPSQAEETEPSLAASGEPTPSLARAEQATPSPAPPSPPPTPSGALASSGIELPPITESAAAAAFQVRELGLALRLREALGVLNRARARWPEDPELRIWAAAWLHTRLGTWAEGRPAWEAAFDADPRRAGELSLLPGPPELYPYGNNVRLLGRQPSNPLPLRGRWTPWLGGRWASDSGVLVASGTGIGTYNLSVALDEEAPRAPSEIEVEVRLAPTGRHGQGFGGIFFAGQGEREFFCLFLVDNPRDPIYRQVGGAEAYRQRSGALPVYARMTHQRGERWEFPLRFSAVVPQASEWLRLGVRFRGPEAEVSVDGAKVATVKLGRDPLGRCGLLKFYSVPVEFRAWKIR